MWHNKAPYFKSTGWLAVEHYTTEWLSSYYWISSHQRFCFLFFVFESAYLTSLAQRNARVGICSLERGKWSNIELANTKMGKLCSKNPTPQWHVGYRLYRVKMTRHCGLVVQGCSGSILVGGEVRVMNHFFGSGGQVWGLLRWPSVWALRKVAGYLHFRAQEPKHNWGQDVICSLDLVTISQVWAGSCCPGGGWLSGGKARLLRGIPRELVFLEPGCKTKFNQSHGDP